MEIDLDDPTVLLRDDVVADPRPLYDMLRRCAPVWRVPGQDTYLVSDPDLVREAVARTDVFSSNLVSLLHRDDAGRPVPFDLAPLGDPNHVLATADPPVHTRHRKLLQPHLSPSAVARLEPMLRRVVDEHLAPLLSAGGGDVVEALGNPVPALAICAVVGLPADDAARLVPLVLGTGAMLDGVTDADGMGQAAMAALELTVYGRTCLDAAMDARAEERTGLLGVLAGGVEAGLLTRDEAQFILVQIFSAGTETTSSLIATSVGILARDHQLQEDLRGDPGLIPDAIEDFLRADGPFQFHYRYTTTGVTLGGTAIPAQSRVLLMWAAANRPPPEDTTPDGGTPGSGPHLAFGRGLHFCIGAPLARLEARVVLEQLLARTAMVTLDPERPVVHRPGILIRRHDSLPVKVVASRVPRGDAPSR